jgi:hypothetical protein
MILNKVFAKLILLLVPFIGIAQNNIEKKQKIVLATNTSQSFRFWKMPTTISSYEQSYFDELLTGLSSELSAHYFLSKKIAYGIKFNHYLSNSGIENQRISIGNLQLAGDIKNNIKINYIGASGLYIPKLNNKTGILSIESSIGWIWYRDNGFLFDEKYKIKAGNFGFNTNLGYHFHITPQLLIGPQINIFGGKIKNATYTINDTEQKIDLNGDNSISLWRLDVGLGFRYKL